MWRTISSQPGVAGRLSADELLAARLFQLFVGTPTLYVGYPKLYLPATDGIVATSSNNSLLGVLTAQDLERLSPHLDVFEARAGSVLYEPEAEVDWVYFPVQGLISVISVMLSGSTTESAVVGREGAVGFVEAAGSGIFLSRALVQADLRALRAPASRYREVLDGSVTLRRAVADHAELNMTEGRQAIACMAHHQADRRLAWWLLECHDRAASGDQLPLTQEFLAAMLGLQRTTVNAVAGQLRDEGLIDFRRAVVTIVDRSGLEAKSCECYATIQHYRRLILARERRVPPP